MVKQRTLEDVLERRALVTDLKRNYDDAKRALEALEDAVVADLDAGLGLERGPLAAGTHEEAVRRPKWKELYTALGGPEATAAAIAATPPTIHRGLVIVDTTRRRDRA